MMKKYLYIVSVVLAALLLGAMVSSCERRPLENQAGDLATISIHIDWSQSTLDLADVHNVSVWFFPQDGSRSFERRYEGNLTDVEAALPKGAYSIVVFNEAVDADWESLRFEGSDKYETFRVEARPDTFRGLDTKVEELEVRKAPDAIASWSMDRFEVTQAMVQAMASRNPTSVQKINVTLKPLTKQVKIRAYIQNLVSATRCSGTLTGVTGAVMLATGKVSGGEVVHKFIMNNRVVDEDNKNNGYIHANFMVFVQPQDAFQKNLLVDFKLRDDTQTPTEVFNVTEEMGKSEVDIEIGIAAKEEEKDHPIILPEVDVAGDVGVDNWEEETIPMI